MVLPFSLNHCKFLIYVRQAITMNMQKAYEYSVSGFPATKTNGRKRSKLQIYNTVDASIRKYICEYITSWGDDWLINLL